MMKRGTILTATVLSVWMVTLDASAGAIGWTQPVHAGLRRVFDDNFVTLSVGVQSTTPGVGSRQAFEFEIRASDGPVERTLTEDDGDAFLLVGELLTDGVNDILFARSTYPNGSLTAASSWESKAFTFPQPGRLDFEGFAIDRIVLRIDGFAMQSPGVDPNGDGIWTDLEYQLALDIHSPAIPEPATWSLLLTAWPWVHTRRSAPSHRVGHPA